VHATIGLSRGYGLPLLAWRAKEIVLEGFPAASLIFPSSGARDDSEQLSPLPISGRYSPNSQISNTKWCIAACIATRSSRYLVISLAVIEKAWNPVAVCSEPGIWAEGSAERPPCHDGKRCQLFNCFNQFQVVPCSTFSRVESAHASK
jgi:hypothetical protein